MDNSGSASGHWLTTLREVSVALSAHEQQGWWLVGGGVALAVVAVLVLLDLAGVAPWQPRGDFRSRPVLTPNETEFYHRLRQALPQRIILAQVSMSALLEPAVPREDREYLFRRNRIAQKYVDYVVCDPRTLIPVAVIELDDRTHDPVKDAQRDAMLEGAGYVVLRWHSRRKPTARVIAKAVAAAERRARNHSHLSDRG